MPLAMITPFTHRKILKKGMPGRAAIIASSPPSHSASSFNMAMTPQVHVEGLTPYEVEDQWIVKSKDTEALSGSIPVNVDRGEHDKVAIDWELPREEHQRHVEQRRRAPAAGGEPAASATPVVDMQNDPELRAKMEAVLGRQLTPGTTERVGGNDPALQADHAVVQEHMAEKAVGSVEPAAALAFDAVGAGEDTVSQLERLVSLRDGGVLSTKEFEQAKRKVLGED